MTISTGIKKLDELIKGYPNGSIVLIKGHPGTGKKLFLGHFLAAHTKKSKSFYVYSDETYQSILNDLKSHGIDLDLNNFFWIDTTNKDSGNNVINCSLDSLFTISLAIKQTIASQNNMNGGFAILSSALMVNEPVIIYKFATEIIQTLKSSGTTTIFTLEEGMHKLEIVTALEHLSDVVIELKFEEKGMDIKRMMRIKKATGLTVDTKFYEFEINKKGVIIY